MPDKTELNPKGYYVKFGDGRVVFLGHDSNYPDANFLGFYNKEKVFKCLVLSHVALQVLTELIASKADPNWGEGLESFPFVKNTKIAYILAWELIDPEDKTNDPPDV